METRVDLTREELTGAVEEFYGARRRGDLALLCFSGHGLLHADRESLFLAATGTELGRLHGEGSCVVRRYERRAGQPYDLVLSGPAGDVAVLGSLERRHQTLSRPEIKVQ